MPVFFLKASSDGRACVLSSTSMYSGQLDQLTTFSVSDRSWAALAVGVEVPVPPLVFLPSLPHAARAAAAPRPAAPTTNERRLTSPRARAARKASEERSGVESVDL